jgi:hypothetical protein
VKTADLIGPALDFAVRILVEKVDIGCPANVPLAIEFLLMREAGDPFLMPSTNWSQGGPIIERLKGFQMKQWLESKPETCCEAHIHNYDGDWITFGPTPLIAALRCYVASKLGDEVDVPESLK